jgi:hypothetical protein
MPLHLTSFDIPHPVLYPSLDVHISHVHSWAFPTPALSSRLFGLTGRFHPFNERLQMNKKSGKEMGAYDTIMMIICKIKKVTTSECNGRGMIGRKKKGI